MVFFKIKMYNLYKWYELYSYWVFILVLLYKLKIININLFPSVLVGLIFVLFHLDFKLRNNIKISNEYFYALLFVHILPLFLIKLTLNLNDIIINLFIFCFYILFVKLTTGNNIYQVYMDLLYSDSNKTISEILKDRGII
jgi:hypothetical protein